MTKENLPSTIGHYEVLKSLGKGGMGEVFLVFDPLCHRKLALKKILPELCAHKVIRERFLREARFAAKLSHPCIIPVYSIEDSADIYYTMAYIEGESLKEIFKSTLEKEKKGLSPHEIGVSIPALTRVFLSVCQAIAYANSKGILHRDLKPDNIMVGKYGEVFLLDWGIATSIEQKEEEDEELSLPILEDTQLTRPGKVIGTVNFMAPERAQKQKASIFSEIYSIGVILYQILTLKLPFVRKNLEHFRKILHVEALLPPEEIAPYRDIPKQLSLIAQKCLQKDPNLRYQTVEELIFDLQNYIEGKPEWIYLSSLDLMKKTDWEFQENVLLSHQMAITDIFKSLEWVGLMISKEGFSGNLKLEFELTLPEGHEGFGVLMCVPEPGERKGLEDGYCLWLGSRNGSQLNLFRASAEIISISHQLSFASTAHKVCIEKIDNVLFVYIGGVLKLSYTSHIPIVGTHLGIVYKNPDFELSSISISLGSQSVMVNCLSVPDAFLANKHFDQAYSEYKKIAESFKGRTEGREAQFRAGLALIEKAKREKNKKEKHEILSSSLTEFEKLKSTPAAPLEYLGKSLVYDVLEEHDEELKCLELAFRKYPGHPMLSVLREQVVFKLHEASKKDKMLAYHFTFLCTRYLPEIFSSPSHKKLLDNLVQHWPKLPFISQKIPFSHSKSELVHIGIQLAFWLNKPLLLMELSEQHDQTLQEHKAFLVNIFYALLFLHKEDLAYALLSDHENVFSNPTLSPYFEKVAFQEYFTKEPILFILEKLLKKTKSPVHFHHLRLFFFLMDKALENHTPSSILHYVDVLSNYATTVKDKDSLRIYRLKLLLLEQKTEEAKELFLTFPKEKLCDPKELLYFLYGTYLWITQGEQEAQKHFNQGLKEHSYLQLPPFTIHEYYPDKSSQKMFFWEKLEIFKKHLFFYTSLKDFLRLEQVQKKLDLFLKHQTLDSR